MNDPNLGPDPAEVILSFCQNDSRLAVTTGPSGEPLCEPCAVRLARRIRKGASKSRRTLAPTIKTRR